MRAYGLLAITAALMVLVSCSRQDPPPAPAADGLAVPEDAAPQETRPTVAVAPVAAVAHPPHTAADGPGREHALHAARPHERQDASGHRHDTSRDQHDNSLHRHHPAQHAARPTDPHRSLAGSTETQRQRHPHPARPTDPRHEDSGQHDAGAAASTESDPLSIFKQRILPILQADRPSSCTECHLSGVELKDYLRPDQLQTFAALRERGLIDTQDPEQSKILEFIGRSPETPDLITDRVRRQEYEAFRAWIVAAVRDPALLAADPGDAFVGPELPDELIRHARRDRVLQSFLDNVWSEIGRCSSCHSPDRNQKQVREHGEQVSWIRLRDPEGTLRHLVDSALIDTDSPADSLLLTKPTLQVDHGGGQKMLVGDRSYKQFRQFIEDYAAVVNGTYRSADQLPQPHDEFSVGTSMEDGVWLKFTDVPARFDKLLLHVDLYRQDGHGWSEWRWAAADRGVAGDRQVWQQTLTLTAPRGSERAEELKRSASLPPGRYLARVSVDQSGKLAKDFRAELDESDFVGEVVIDARWSTGHGRMTVARFPSLR